MSRILAGGLQEGDVVQFLSTTAVIEYDENLYMYCAGEYPLYQAVRMKDFRKVGHVTDTQWQHLKQPPRLPPLSEKERWYEYLPEKIPARRERVLGEVPGGLTFGR